MLIHRLTMTIYWLVKMTLADDGVWKLAFLDKIYTTARDALADCKKLQLAGVRGISLSKRTAL